MRPELPKQRPECTTPAPVLYNALLSASHIYVDAYVHILCCTRIHT